MTSRASLLDTDTLSVLMRSRDVALQARARAYLSDHHRFGFSLMTRYEVLRGLKAKGAARQLRDFEGFCLVNTVLPITDAVIVRAADLHADLRRRGQLISDADLIIAATALTEGLVLVTSNTAHFGRIAELSIECWATPSVPSPGAA